MKKKWEILHTGGIDDLVTLLLQNRGITDLKDIEEFLHPKLENVTVDRVGINKKHLKIALKRIADAIAKKEQIIVYGDYDVDGITGTAILWEALNSLGAYVMPYIPHRVDEGYGLSIKGLENIKKYFETTSLIITVDNGIVANQAVDFANELGIDVIITDHHVAHGGEEHGQPKALAIVHTTNLCGAGVAYVLSKQLMQQIPASTGKTKKTLTKTTPTSESEEDTHLELATLGTIADLVPLTGANRAIVKHGLKRLCETKRPGLLAMFREAACQNSSLGVYEVGHIIAPRLNAAGRLKSAMDSLRLLCTRDPERAELLAQNLGLTNKERQTIMRDSASHATLLVKSREGELKKLLFVAHESYKEGVIGLVAGRLVEEFYRPAIVISIGEEKSKGSVRSIAGFNMIEFLRAHEQHFINVGGHPMAAGFTVETAKIPQLQEALETMAETAVDESILSRTLKIDCELSLEKINDELYTSLQTLAPFGMGNPEPVFFTKGARITDMRILGKDGKHLKLKVKQHGTVHEAIAFGMADLTTTYHIGDEISLAYTIDENIWNGRRTLQLKVKDITS